MSGSKRPRVFILKSSKTEGSGKMENSRNLEEEDVAIEEEEGDQSGLQPHEEITGEHGDDVIGLEDSQQRRLPANVGAKKRMVERNEHRRQLVGEPPLYADVALGFDDVETLLLYPETISAEKIGFTVPSGTQLSDATFIISLRSLASPKDIRTDALGKWCTSSTLSRYYEVTGDTFARVDRGGRAPMPDTPWDIKIMNTYSRNPSAGKKLKKNIYERYEVDGRMGPFAIITYVWDPDVTPFQFEVLPHGNKKFNGARLSGAIQLPPEAAMRFGAEMDSMTTGSMEVRSEGNYESANRSMEISSTGEMSVDPPGPMDAVAESEMRPSRFQYKSPSSLMRSNTRSSRWQRSGPIFASNSGGGFSVAKRSRLAFNSMDSKEKLECEVLALKKEKLRMEIHRMAAETDKLEAEREKIEREKKKLDAEILLITAQKEQIEADRDRTEHSGRDSEEPPEDKRHPRRKGAK